MFNYELRITQALAFSTFSARRLRVACFSVRVRVACRRQTLRDAVGYYELILLSISVTNPSTSPKQFFAEGLIVGVVFP
jgi:hypothetical protein